MTGNELIYLKNGDLLKLIIPFYSLIDWKVGDILKVELKESIQRVWVRNLTAESKKYEELVTLLDTRDLLNNCVKISADAKLLNLTQFSHKFNVGDTVWYMGDNKPMECTITAMDYKVSDVDLSGIVIYCFKDSMGLFVSNRESSFYATKEELLNRLK